MSCGYEKNPYQSLGNFEVNRVVCRPSVFSDIGNSCVRLHIPNMFFSSSFKASASLAYITPWAVSTRYFVNHVRLQINRICNLTFGPFEEERSRSCSLCNCFTFTNCFNEWPSFFSAKKGHRSEFAMAVLRLILGVKTCDPHQWRKTKKTKKSTQ